MQVQKRRVNVKRHTVGYKISGRWMSREQAWSLAKNGRLEGVVACNGKNGKYIQSHPTADVALYELDAIVV